MNPGLLSLLVLAIIHLFANKAKIMGWVWRGWFLSFAAGISFAYVFVGLLPALERGQIILKKAFGPVIPYLDRHAYVIALLGVLFYYGLHTRGKSNTRLFHVLLLAGYLLFNFFVGASLSDNRNPDIQPIVIFTIAMGMYYFVRDHNASTLNPVLFEHQTRWLLVIALFAGYYIGYFLGISDSFVAIIASFLSGGILLNVLGYELPKREELGYACFVAGALIYTAILLCLS